MRQTKRSFSLVEILVSLSILALGIIVLFNIFPVSWRTFAYSRKLNEVSVLAQKKLEELKSMEQFSATEMSGEEKDLKWNINLQPIKLDNDIELLQVELAVEFYFQESVKKEKFITYLAEKSKPVE